MTPREFKPGDRVQVSEEATWSNGYVSASLRSVRGGEAVVREDDWVDGDVPLVGGASVAPKYLTLVERPGDPAPVEPTDEQRAAVEWLRAITIDAYARQEVTFAQELLAALPDSLTNPQPALPTEPGPYEQEDGTVVTLRGAGGWWRGGHMVTPELPLHRLVRERPQLTMEDLTRVYAEHTGALGVPITLARDLLKLANGTPDE